MDIRITYCGSWGYEARAASLAAELERDFGARATLAKSSGGVFEVEADGRLVYSKRSSGRFPQAGEVARALRTW